MRVAIIGAGPSGICAMASYAELKNKGQPIPEVVAFERQDTIGGLWNYNWRTGVDKDGWYVHNGQYQHLWSNSPKECLEFPDYTFEKHFGENTCSYPPRLAYRDYLVGFYQHHKCDDKWVRYNTIVKNVVWDETEKKFHLTARDTSSEYTEKFDYVIVSTGHFSNPAMPYYNGIENFSGLVLHSHDFRVAEAYKGQTVVVVGRSYSAEDVASQLYKYGAKHVIITHRKGLADGKQWEPTGYHWPQGIEEKPLMKNIKGNTVTFHDDSQAEADTIILCTGYRHHFPFLGKSINLECENKFWNKELYLSVVSKQCPHLFFLSMQDQYYTFNTFAAQAWYVRDLTIGRLARDTPLKDMSGKEWRDQDFVTLFDNMETKRHAYELQGKFTEVLMNMTGYGKDCVDPLKFVEGINKAWDEWLDLKHADIMTYRDHAHTSPVTGTMSPKPDAKKDWLSNKWEDDVAFYKNLHKACA